MAKKSIGLTGTTGKTYDLDVLANSDTRSDTSTELFVQIWKWCPDLPVTNPHKYPNPCRYDAESKKIVSTLKLGQMWMSKLVAKDSDDYAELLKSDD